jgi:hypothetical protein
VGGEVEHGSRHMWVLPRRTVLYFLRQTGGGRGSIERRVTVLEKFTSLSQISLLSRRMLVHFGVCVVASEREGGKVCGLCGTRSDLLRSANCGSNFSRP